LNGSGKHTEFKIPASKAKGALTATSPHLDANTEAALSERKSAVLNTSNQNGQKNGLMLMFHLLLRRFSDAGSIICCYGINRLY
jgi:hypothetical protein